MRRHILYAQKWLTWELTSITITTLIVWVLSGSFLLATSVIGASLVPRAIAYHIHEMFYARRHKKLQEKL